MPLMLYADRFIFNTFKNSVDVTWTGTLTVEMEFWHFLSMKTSDGNFYR